jgi:hypothetical protein
MSARVADVVGVHDELAYPAAAREHQWGEQASW